MAAHARELGCFQDGQGVAKVTFINGRAGETAYPVPLSGFGAAALSVRGCDGAIGHLNVFTRGDWQRMSAECIQPFGGPCVQDGELWPIRDFVIHFEFSRGSEQYLNSIYRVVARR